MNTNLYVLIPVLVSCLSPAYAQHRVEVTITGIQDTSGVVMVGLFRDSQSFMKKPAVGMTVKAAGGQAIAQFEDVPPGEYAVSVIHDANQNGKLDANLLGIPREGFGFSNDAMGTFGPPSFEKAKFKVAGLLRIRVRTRYL
jgi:uncharacterized protein (DUF2141 family)